MYQLPFKLLPRLDKWCHVYHDQTFVCLLPHYLPVAFLLIAILVTIMVMCAIAWKLRRARVQKDVIPKSCASPGSRRRNNDHNVSENLLDQNRNIRETH